MTCVFGLLGSKAIASLTGCKSADFPLLTLTYRILLWSLGVFPTIEIEPVKAKDSLKTPELPARKSIWAATRTEASVTPIVVSNHLSYIDGAVLALFLSVPRIVAMAGSLKVPLFGPLVKEIECICIDRSDPNSRKLTMDAIEKHCQEWKPGSRPLLIFPEGTVSNGESLLPFRKGAFIPGAPVRPVLLVYTGSWTPAATTFYKTHRGEIKEDTLWQWFVQVSCHIIKPMRIVVLPPYYPTAEEARDPELYASNVRRLMLQELEEARSRLRPSTTLKQD